MATGQNLLDLLLVDDAVVLEQRVSRMELDGEPHSCTVVCRLRAGEPEVRFQVALVRHTEGVEPRPSVFGLHGGPEEVRVIIGIQAGAASAGQAQSSQGVIPRVISDRLNSSESIGSAGELALRLVTQKREKEVGPHRVGPVR